MSVVEGETAPVTHPDESSAVPQSTPAAPATGALQRLEGRSAHYIVIDVAEGPAECTAILDLGYLNCKGMSAEMHRLLNEWSDTTPVAAAETATAAGADSSAPTLKQRDPVIFIFRQLVVEAAAAVSAPHDDGRGGRGGGAYPRGGAAGRSHDDGRSPQPPAAEGGSPRMFQRLLGYAVLSSLPKPREQLPKATQRRMPKTWAGLVCGVSWVHGCAVIITRADADSADLATAASHRAGHPAAAGGGEALPSSHTFSSLLAGPEFIRQRLLEKSAQLRDGVMGGSAPPVQHLCPLSAALMAVAHWHELLGGDSPSPPPGQPQPAPGPACCNLLDDAARMFLPRELRQTAMAPGPRAPVAHHSQAPPRGYPVPGGHYLPQQQPPYRQAALPASAPPVRQLPQPVASPAPVHHIRIPMAGPDVGAYGAYAHAGGGVYAGYGVSPQGYTYAAYPSPGADYYASHHAAAAAAAGYGQQYTGTSDDPSNRIGDAPPHQRPPPPQSSLPQSSLPQLFPVASIGGTAHPTAAAAGAAPQF